VTVPPLVFAAEVVLVLTLAAGTAAAWLGFSDGTVERLRRNVRGFLRPHLRGQQDIAQSLGLSLRAWVALRIVAGLTGLLLGSITGLLTVTVAGALLGVFGLPWLLAGRAAKRRLRMERALATLALAVRNLMQQSNLALDRALREAARSPAPELSWVLSPLTGDVQVSEALVEVSRRARSPLGDLVVTAMLVARTHNPLALVKVTDEVVLPLMEQAVGVQEENHATVAQQRTAALAIGVILGILFFSVMRVPSLYAYYSTAGGQLVLIVVIGMYLGLVWLLGRMARPLEWVEWDIAAVRREAEALIG
jgi:hypothetical protein